MQEEFDTVLREVRAAKFAPEFVTALLDRARGDKTTYIRSVQASNYPVNVLIGKIMYRGDTVEFPDWSCRVGSSEHETLAIAYMLVKYKDLIVYGCGTHTWTECDDNRCYEASDDSYSYWIKCWHRWQPAMARQVEFDAIVARLKRNRQDDDRAVYDTLNNARGMSTAPIGTFGFSDDIRDDNFTDVISFPTWSIRVIAVRDDEYLAFAAICLKYLNMLPTTCGAHAWHAGCKKRKTPCKPPTRHDDNTIGMNYAYWIAQWRGSDEPLAIELEASNVVEGCD